MSYAITIDKQGTLGARNDYANLLDIVFVALCGIGLLKCSRTAAILILIYWVLAKIYAWMILSHASGVVVDVIFLYFFANATRGTFAYRNIQHRQKSYQAPRYKWPLIVGKLLGLLVVGFALYVVLMEAGYFPSTATLSEDKISDYHRSKLVAAGFISENERLIFFYSNALVSVLSDGNVLTDRRVISYELVDGENEYFSAVFDEIHGFEIKSRGDSEEPTVVEIHPIEKESFILFLSADDDKDLAFLRALSKEVYGDEKIFQSLFTIPEP